MLLSQLMLKIPPMDPQLLLPQLKLKIQPVLPYLLLSPPFPSWLWQYLYNLLMVAMKNILCIFAYIHVYTLF